MQVLDIIIEYTAAYCLAHPVLPRWFASRNNDGLPCARFILPYREKIINGRRTVFLRDDENGLLYSFKQFVQVGRHVDDGIAPPPNRIVLTWKCDENNPSGFVSVYRAWHEEDATNGRSGMLNGEKSIPCETFGWNERPMSPADVALFENVATVPTAAPTAAHQKKQQTVSQAKAAEMCGVTPITIRRWEKRVGTPTDYPGRKDWGRFTVFSQTYKLDKRFNKAEVIRDHPDQAIEVDERDREKRFGGKLQRKMDAQAIG